MELSNRFAVPLIEDNAQGHGARCGERDDGIDGGY